MEEELSTGDIAAIRVQSLRLIVFGLAVAVAERSGEGDTMLARLERIVKAGVDAAAFNDIGPFDGEVVKHVALEEIERFFQVARQGFREATVPQNDRPQRQPRNR